jgi:thioredoxin 1
MQVIKDKKDFQVALKNDYVLVDCTATWCGPCQKIAPKIHTLSEDKDYEDVSFYIYDIDDDDELSEEYVRVVPTFLLFKDGEMFKKIEGADYKRIVKSLKEMLVESSSSDEEEEDEEDS